MNQNRYNNFLFQILFDKEKNEISKYYIDRDKNTQCIKEEFFKPLFIKKVDFNSINITTIDAVVEYDIMSYSNEECVKITPKSQEAKEEVENIINLYNFKTFEFDINESNYYLIETQEEICGGINYELSKIVSLDIETLGEEDNQYINLVSCSSYCEEYSNKVFVNCEALHNNFKNLKDEELSFDEDFQIIWCENERELLHHLIEDIKTFQPQFIVGWNVIGFDFKIIKQRCSYYNIEFNVSTFEGESIMRVSNTFFGKDMLQFPGILVLDGIQLLKTNYIIFDDYKLNSVSREVLGAQKVDLDESEDSDYSISEKIKTIEHNWRTNPKKLIWYNYKDSTLVLDILKQLDLMNLMIERSVITQTIIERLQSPIAVLDQMYLKELHKQQKVAITHYPSSGTTPIEGAYIIDPTIGFYEDIVIFDFASLYPSIMITFNIDPFSYSTKGDITAPNGATFSSKMGILPEILKTLFKLRRVAKSQGDTIKSHALKITMNSFYGAMASSKARYYNTHLAESITSFGRECLLEAKKFLEEKGVQVIYGDTDSVFVKGIFLEDSTLLDKQKWVKKIEQEINEHFNLWVSEQFNVESFLKIEGEKIFEKFYISTKKRYVGQDYDKKLHFTGLEAIRGDWTQLAKEFQVQLVTQIFNGKKNEEIKQFILNEITSLKSKVYDSKLVYLKKITKPLNEYIKTTPPHVKAAREIDNFSGRVVKYVMTLKGPKHISLFNIKTMEYDYEHYVDKQLKGVSSEMLSILGIDFDEVVNGKKQSKLNEFF